MAIIFQESSSVKVGFAVVLCVMVFYTHRENIGRLWRGEENRMDLAGRGRGTP
jgi:glycerol-3-phosphate acyltransferase PlsY